MFNKGINRFGGILILSLIILIIIFYVFYRYRKKNLYFHQNLNDKQIKKIEIEKEKENNDNNIEINSSPTIIEELMRKSLELAKTAEQVADHNEKRFSLKDNIYLHL